MAGLISDQLLDNLRNVAYRQLITPLTIQRFTKTTTVADTTESWATVESTTGWLVGKNVPRVTVGPDDRAIIDNLYELRLRQGTNILAADRVIIGGEYYSVIDVNSEVTISLFLKASLARIA